jgi:hypothetical protein
VFEFPAAAARAGIITGRFHAHTAEEQPLNLLSRA